MNELIWHVTPLCAVETVFHVNDVAQKVNNGRVSYSPLLFPKDAPIAIARLRGCSLYRHPPPGHNYPHSAKQNFS